MSLFANVSNYSRFELNPFTDKNVFLWRAEYRFIKTGNMSSEGVYLVESD